MRPSEVLNKERGIKNWAMGFVPSVRVDELAAALVDTAVNGTEQQTVENSELRTRGRELLHTGKRPAK